MNIAKICDSRITCQINVYLACVVCGQSTIPQAVLPLLNSWCLFEIEDGPLRLTDFEPLVRI